MKIKLIAIITFVIGGLITLIVGWYFYTMKVPGIDGVEADYNVTADELYNAFEQEEAKAMELYEGKVISVQGEIISIKDNEKGTNITLKAENAMIGGINCSFNNAINEQSKGDIIRIKGRCQGLLMDVILNNCVVNE